MCKASTNETEIRKKQQVTEKQAQLAGNDTYTIRKTDTVSYHQQAGMLGEKKYNYLQHNVRKAIIDNLGRERYAAIDSLKIKNAGDEPTESIRLHHTRGSRLALEGEDVIEFNVAGSGFNYFRKDHKGIVGFFDKDEYREKDIEVSWYNKYLSWLPGIKSKTHIEELNSNRLETNRKIKEAYGDVVQNKIKGKKLGHLRKKESVNDQNATKTRFFLKGPNSLNLGKYSEDNLEEYILELGKSTLKSKFDHWDLLGDDELERVKPVNIIIQGHSRGAVASGLGAMRIKRWIADRYPRFLSKVRFELIQHDPVAGGPENYGYNEKIDHRPENEELAKRDPRYMSLGSEANTTVVYSMHTNYPAAFTPQKVLNPKRIILTMADHAVNLGQTDNSQEGSVTRVTYLAEKQGKIEAFRSSGLGELDDGIYMTDDQYNLIRIRSMEEYDAIAKQLLSGTILQGSRHDVVRDAVRAWFERHGEMPAEEMPDAEKKEEIPEDLSWTERITDLFTELCGQIKDERYDLKLKKNIKDEIWSRISVESDDDSVYCKQFRDAVEHVKDLVQALNRNAGKEERPGSDRLLEAMIRLSETAEVYYDTHRGHQYTDKGKSRRKACDLVRELTSEFFDRLDIATGGKGHGNIVLKKKSGNYGNEDRILSKKKMEELSELYANWKKHFAGQEGMERTKIRNRARLFEPYRRYIDMYKACHPVKEWPKDIEEIIKTAARLKVQDEVITRYENTHGALADPIIAMSKAHVDRIWDKNAENTLSLKKLDDGLLPEQIAKVQEIDHWFLKNYNNTDITATLAGIRNHHSIMVSNLMSLSVKERLFIYYLIETNKRKKPETYDVIASQEYSPSLTKFKNRMRTSRFKALSRIRGGYLYMHKMSQAMQISREYQELILNCAESGKDKPQMTEPSGDKTYRTVKDLLGDLQIRNIKDQMFDGYFKFDPFVKDVVSAMAEKGRHIYNLESFKANLRRVLAASANFADLPSACDWIAKENT